MPAYFDFSEHIRHSSFCSEQKAMLGSFTFWLKAAGVMQLLTSVFHLLGTLSSRAPANATEEQLETLVKTYQFDLGLGFSRTMYDISFSMSLCFTLLCLFAGVLNWYIAVQDMPPTVVKGITTIQLVIFAILFGLMVRYTFLPPIVCTGLIVILLIAARFVR